MNTPRSLISVSLAFLAACASALAAADPREATHLAVLNSAAGLHEKARACQELASVGGAASVPALAALLADEHLADYARSGLEVIPDPAAGRALREALARLEGRRLAGAVNSLGVRREIAAVPELQKLALDPKRGVAAEAVAALGLMGTAPAADTLRTALTSGPADLRTPAGHAALVASEQLARAGNRAAARGLLEAVARAHPGAPLAKVAQAQLAALGASR